MLFNSKKSIYTARRSQFNGKCDQEAHLLMILEGENRHYTAINNLQTLLKFLNTTYRGAYHFCINYLNGFRIASARNKYFEYYSSNVKKSAVATSYPIGWVDYTLQDILGQKF